MKINETKNYFLYNNNKNDFPLNKRNSRIVNEEPGTTGFPHLLHG